MQVTESRLVWAHEWKNATPSRAPLLPMPDKPRDIFPGRRTTWVLCVQGPGALRNTHAPWFVQCGHWHILQRNKISQWCQGQRELAIFL